MGTASLIEATSSPSSHRQAFQIRLFLRKSHSMGSVKRFGLVKRNLRRRKLSRPSWSSPILPGFDQSDEENYDSSTSYESFEEENADEEVGVVADGEDQSMTRSSLPMEDFINSVPSFQSSKTSVSTTMSDTVDQELANSIANNEDFYEDVHPTQMSFEDAEGEDEQTTYVDYFNGNAANLLPWNPVLVWTVLAAHDFYHIEWPLIAEAIQRIWCIEATSSAVVLQILQCNGRIREGVWWD